MKLNLQPYRVIENDDDLKFWQLREDWLTLEAECTKRGELIEKLNHALQNESENTTTRKLTITESALSAVEEWRKEQK